MITPPDLKLAKYDLSSCKKNLDDVNRYNEELLQTNRRLKAEVAERKSREELLEKTIQAEVNAKLSFVRQLWKLRDKEDKLSEKPVPGKLPENNMKGSEIEQRRQEELERARKEITKQRQELERNFLEKEKQLMAEKELEKAKMQQQLLAKQKVLKEWETEMHAKLRDEQAELENGKFQMEQMKMMLAEKERALEEEQQRMTASMENQRQILEASANAEAQERRKSLLKRSNKLKMEHSALLKLKKELEEAKIHLEAEADVLSAKKLKQEHELAQQKREVEESRRTIALLTAVTIESTTVTVSHPYAANSIDELTIQPGETLTVMQKNTDGWWKGVNQTSGALGWFPANHVIEKAPDFSLDGTVSQSVEDEWRDKAVALEKENSDLQLRLKHAGEQIRHLVLEGQDMDARVRMQQTRIRELEAELMRQRTAAPSLGLVLSPASAGEDNAFDNLPAPPPEVVNQLSPLIIGEVDIPASTHTKPARKPIRPQPKVPQQQDATATTSTSMETSDALPEPMPEEALTPTPAPIVGSSPAHNDDLPARSNAVKKFGKRLKVSDSLALTASARPVFA